MSRSPTGGRDSPQLRGSANRKKTLDKMGRLRRRERDRHGDFCSLAMRNVARYTGSEIVKVSAAYTSQTCSVCRAVDPESCESQAVFRCTRCGHTEHADVNAAKNILTAGRGGDSL